MELTAIIMIIALASAAVTLNLRALNHKSQLRNAAGQVAAFDAVTRSYALEQDRPLNLAIDLSAGRLVRTDAASKAQVGLPLLLGGNCKIAKLIAFDKTMADGNAVVAFSRRGFTHTYAVCLAKPDGAKRWLVFVGLTGQLLELDDDRQVQEILAVAAGNNAG